MFGNMLELAEQAKGVQKLAQETVEEFRQKLADIQLDLNKILENQNEILQRLNKE